MTADMGGPKGRSGFGWSAKDGDRRSPLKGENRKVLSGGDIFDWTAKQADYVPDPVDPSIPVVPKAPGHRWLRFRRRSGVAADEG